MAGPTPTATIVVGLRLHVLEPAALYRVEATVQALFNGAVLYQEHVGYEASWADVLTWLTALLSSTDATTTVADHLLSLRSM